MGKSRPCPRYKSVLDVPANFQITLTAAVSPRRLASLVDVGVLNAPYSSTQTPAL